jgi:hypothetical protein
MPLVGLVDGERVVSSLLTTEQWAALKADIRAKRRALVLPCGLPGHAKTSKLGTAYFAHNAGGDQCSAGETPQHLLAKSLILQAIAAVGWTAEPEVAGDGWVADVMATRGSTRVVFEVQWSRQSREDYRHRQQRYQDAGIASIAWFARHTDGLSAVDQSLPVFGLAISDEGDATATVGDTSLPLAEVVERLLTRRLQYRTYLSDAQPATARVDGARIDCYRCGKPFGVWSVERINVGGRCGSTGYRGRPVTDDFPTVRPETDPAIREAGARLAKKVGVAPANLGTRSTKASGTRYMAFVCPHCAATCGEMYVRKEFGVWDNHGLSALVPVAPTAVRQPHWCLARTDGTCLEPPEQVVNEVQRLEAHAQDDGTLTDVEPFRPSKGISVHQAISRMFGGGYGR